MTYKEYNAFCKSLPATTYVMQWGGSHVWKVGGKVFAIGGKPSTDSNMPTRAVNMIRKMTLILLLSWSLEMMLAILSEISSSVKGSYSAWT